MAVIVQIEIPQRMNSIISDSFSRSEFTMSSLATKNGWEINPTRRSETAKLRSIDIEVDRMRGVFIMANTTNVLPLIEIRISATFKAQFTTTRVFCVAHFSPSAKTSVELILHLTVEFISNQTIIFLFFHVTKKLKDNSCNNYARISWQKTSSVGSYFLLPFRFGEQLLL